MADNYNDYNNMGRQKDIVLAPNEYTFVLSKTNGVIKTHTGPMTMTISAQESLVIFNSKSKQFVEVADIEKAKQLFVSAPEGWYVVLKNPAKDNMHPETGKASNSPELEVGKKINVAGPCSFSLYPGQMAKVVRGHRLRSNQYLLARVYDAEAAKDNKAAAMMIDAEGKEIVDKKINDYFMGQLLVIKGTEVSFYVPPTGIEVIPCSSNDYVREAVTLERLEYAILKDEDGEKRYVHGPAVVFPKPTETFVETPKGGTIFRALELSPISGIYVKVIAAYKDEKGVQHPIGEELFITGKDQMIYYPRPEHAMIQYDGKYMHHAIAIPEGEGRYILNRLDGKITTIVGPQMYLPDPRTEVVVKRKLTRKECELLYPGNTAVLEYNDALSEQAVARAAKKGLTTTDAITNAINTCYSTADQSSTLAIFEANANISRGSSYTKPRTITLDTQYEGAVSVNVWTGYAVNVVSKTGKREVVVGPKTRLLDYDETLEAVSLSTGCPKNTDYLDTTAYLRIENNKISDEITAQTKDYVDVRFKVSYCVNFLEEYKDKWFNVENYVKYMTDRMRSLLKREIKKHDIQDFYSNSTDIIRNIVLNKNSNKDKNNTINGRLFKENGMLVHDVEVLRIDMNRDISNLFDEHQLDMIEKALELNDAENKIKLIEALTEADKKNAEMANAKALYKLELQHTFEKEKFEKEQALAEQERAAKKAKADAEFELQAVLNNINEAKLARDKAENDAKVALQKELEAIEEAKQKAYAETVKEIMESISPDLVAALSTKANAELLTEATKNMSAFSIANGESISETVDRLLRGTTLEGVLSKVTDKN